MIFLLKKLESWIDSMIPWRQHLISVDQLDVQAINEIFRVANKPNFGMNKPLGGKRLTNLFYEPSTRTFASFAAAMDELGGTTIPIQNVEYSSVTKGETLEDTIQTMAIYSDIIALRHPWNDSAEKAAAVSSVPIINAGAGIGEHPTQALLDLYTIYRKFNSIDGLHIGFMGDLKYGRTVHSLVKLLRNYDVNLHFISPPDLKIAREYISLNDSEWFRLGTIIGKLDVLYVTRTQLERHPFKHFSPDFYLYPADMKTAKQDMIIMHPFPRTGELPKVFDTDPRAEYFNQMKRGLTIRKALLAIMLHAE